MKLGLFISGTDTHIGKTVVSSLITSALKTHGMPCGYFKPVQSGTDFDTHTVKTLANLKLEEVRAPLYSFPEAIAPSEAAQLNKIEIQTSFIKEVWRSFSERHWIVEGAGGLLSPLSPQATNRDLITTLGLPMLLVTSSRLGTINHTLLTLEAAQSKSIPIKGLVIVGDENPKLENSLRQFTEVPILVRIPELPSLNAETVQTEGARLFSKSMLGNLFPALPGGLDD